MDAQRRSQYLEAIGIDVWVPRRGVPGGSAAAASGPAAATPMIEEAESADMGVAAALADGSARRGVAAGSDVSAPSDVAVREPLGLRQAVSQTVRQGAASEVAPEIPAGSEAVQVPPSVSRGPSVPLPAERVVEWDRLRSEVAVCTKCALHSSRTQGVFGVGNPQADWLVIGEAPGAEEDRRGEPFVGRAGQLLDAMLKSIGLSRETNAFIANVLKSRPPGNRDPKPEEVAACLPYLMRQIALMRPRLILAVGRIAAQNLLSTDMPLGRLRGKVHHFGELNTPLIVTYHPAYLLRTPADKRKAWEDLKFARGVFRQLT